MPGFANETVIFPCHDYTLPKSFLWFRFSGDLKQLLAKLLNQSRERLKATRIGGGKETLQQALRKFRVTKTNLKKIFILSNWKKLKEMGEFCNIQSTKVEPHRPMR